MIYIASMAAMAMTGEHAEDVLRRLLGWLKDGQSCALVIVTQTEGGAVRAPGALLAVGPETTIGYISGGCIDADVAFRARQACETGTPQQLRYGAGSPFVDLPLPCGGAIHVQILPHPNEALIAEALAVLTGRKQLSLTLTPDGELELSKPDLHKQLGGKTFLYAPKLRLRIAGRGADALALAKLSDAAGYDTLVQFLDEDDIAEAHIAGLKQIEKLTVVSELGDLEDDPWTAFVLLFHDQDWETPLLQQALAGPSFYIGAVGSRRTHANRCEALRAAGSHKDDIERIHGPIGLVPSLRDASFLAISTLAEIIQAFPGAITATRQNTALLMLAAGASNRFETGDKLLAELDGKPVLEHSATLSVPNAVVLRVAVTPAKTSPRSALLQSQGWQVIENPNYLDGQASSLKCGIDEILRNPEIDQIIILLGDMPNVPVSHLSDLIQVAQQNRVTAIMSESEGVLCPPALFKRPHFDALASLDGDRGAKSVFLDLKASGATLELTPDQARDIDCVADLKLASEMADA